MTITEYIGFLLSEIEWREENLEVLRNLQVSPMDSNYRLEQGYLNAIVKIYKDLCNISGIEVSEEFYLDTDGLLDE